ncbi:MAG: type II toxin-antitoxin system Phd/YefM family antitoxin [Firmicutes bacterium]|nr:type II toxin-antitoxin system Phd/YefM family antitoxin [Bacillota bacterium]
MRANMRYFVSINEADKDFSRLTRLADENGMAVIVKDDTPCYVLVPYRLFHDAKYPDDEEVLKIGEEIMKEHWAAFAELAK